MGLEAIRLKFNRAREHFEDIQEAIADDISTYGGTFTVEPDGKETIHLLQPTPIISMLAGELIYQLRSALDHLAFDLVKVNRSGVVLPQKWEDNCQFPIWCDPLKPGQRVPFPYSRFNNLPGIPVEAHAIIEGVQPYYPAAIRTRSVHTYLWLLNTLSNIDKHRRFAVTRTRARVSHSIVYKSGFRGESLDTLDHGAEIPVPYAGEDDPIVNVERSTSFTVAFDERAALGDASGMPIDYLLNGIIVDVWGEVIYPLIKFLA